MQVQGQPGQQPVLIDTIRRQEVEAVLNNQNIILNTAREIKSFMGEVYSKTESILNNQAHAPTAQVFILFVISKNNSQISQNFSDINKFHRCSQWDTIISHS